MTDRAKDRAKDGGIHDMRDGNRESAPADLHGRRDRLRVAYPDLPAELQRCGLERFRALARRQADSDLADVLLAALLGDEPALERAFRHSGRARQECAREAARKAARALFQALPGGTDALAPRAVETLLAAVLEESAALEAQVGGPSRDASGLAEAFSRALADGQEVEAAYRRAIAELAAELYRAVGGDLAARVGQLLSGGGTLDGGGAGPVGTGAHEVRPLWLRPGSHLLLSVDHTSLSCARYLSGLQEPSSDSYGFDELRSARAGRGKRTLEVTVKVDAAPSPGLREAGLEYVASRPSELKAKVFALVLALAVEAAAQGQGRFRVRLSEVMALLGFALGRRTSSSYYWSYAAEVTRYLLADLPSRVVAMQVSLPHQLEPLVVFERLLAHASAVASEPGLLEAAVLSVVQGGDPSLLARAVREAGLQGFELELSEDMMRALGLSRPMNALEEVPAALFALKGPAFWLAWQVAFLRRWAAPPGSGRGGKILLRVLQEAGYVTRFSRGAKVRFKDALAAWWSDVGELVTMGLLDEPGVRLHGWRGGGWQEISTELSRLLDPAGGRVTERALQETRVVYAIPAERVAQLQGARRRSERLKKARGRPPAG
ncbi:MAG: hypothetical protein M3498_05770 [Deinococcota bacterium]|nr:hypothetical protein [Deinococcota bacterium]